MPCKIYETSLVAKPGIIIIIFYCAYIAPCAEEANNCVIMINCFIVIMIKKRLGKERVVAFSF